MKQEDIERAAYFYMHHTSNETANVESFMDGALWAAQQFDDNLAKSLREKVINFVDMSEENSTKVYNYVNGNLNQCCSWQLNDIICELNADQILELYTYIFNDK